MGYSGAKLLISQSLITKILSQMGHEVGYVVKVGSINSLIKDKNSTLKEILDIIEQAIIDTGNTDVYRINIYVYIYTNNKSFNFKSNFNCDLGNNLELEKNLGFLDLIFYCTRKIRYDMVYKYFGYTSIITAQYRNCSKGPENRLRQKGIIVGLYARFLETILFDLFIMDKELPIYIQIIKHSREDLFKNV